MYTLIEGESIDELLCDVEQSPAPLFHMYTICIVFFELLIPDILHV